MNLHVRKRRHRMIEILPGSGGNVLGYRASGKLTDADYKDVLVPKLEEVAKQYD
jgi:hypothetical protein